MEKGWTNRINNRRCSPVSIHHPMSTHFPQPSVSVVLPPGSQWVQIQSLLGLKLSGRGFSRCKYKVDWRKLDEEKSNQLLDDGLMSSRCPCLLKWRVLDSPQNRAFPAGAQGSTSTHSPPLSWSLKDIAYKRGDSRRRPSCVVLLHLGATAARLRRDKVVPFSFCVLRPIF